MTATAEALLSQAEVLLRARSLTQAWSTFQRAQAQGADPDACAAGRWQIAMLQGNFESAWRESDAIRARAKEDPHRFWNGEPFEGKRVILRSLHGYGDAVQMLRYAPSLQARATKLILEVAPPLRELALFFDGIDEVISWGAFAPAKTPEWDIQIEVNELPYIFRTQSTDLPLKTNYLRLPAHLRQTVDAQPHAPGALRVGLVWASGEWNPSRSIPLPLFHTLLDTPDVEFWNLQGGPARAAWNHLASSPCLHSADECAESIVALAALINELDLVIMPDTLASHLAGALGKPALVLLEHAADWRWQHQRHDSPWYPSLRLFRQAEHGDWATPLAAVHAELSTLATRRRKYHAA